MFACILFCLQGIFFPVISQTTFTLPAQVKGTGGSPCPGAPVIQPACNCPTGYVAVGYTATHINAYGDVVSNFKLNCQKLNSDGTLGVSTTVTCSNGTMAPSPGELTATVTAPAGHALVGFENRMGCAIDQLTGKSLPLTEIAASSFASLTTLASIGGAGGGPLPGQLVPPGYVIIGMIPYIDPSGTYSPLVINISAGYAWVYALYSDIQNIVAQIKVTNKTIGTKNWNDPTVWQTLGFPSKPTKFDEVEFDGTTNGELDADDDIDVKSLKIKPGTNFKVKLGTKKLIINGGKLETKPGSLDAKDGKLHLKGNTEVDADDEIGELDVDAGDGNSVDLKQHLKIKKKVHLMKVKELKGVGKELQNDGDLELDNDELTGDGKIVMKGTTNQKIKGVGPLHNIEIRKGGLGKVQLDDDDLHIKHNKPGLPAKFKNDGTAVESTNGKKVILEDDDEVEVDSDGEIDNVEPKTKKTTLKKDLIVKKKLEITKLDNLDDGGTGKKLIAKGDVAFNAPNMKGTGKVEMSGPGDQKISGNGKVHKLDISKLSGEIKLQTDLKIAHNVPGQKALLKSNKAIQSDVPGTKVLLDDNEEVEVDVDGEIGEVATSAPILTLMKELQVKGNLTINQPTSLPLAPSLPAAPPVSVKGNLAVQGNITGPGKISMAGPSNASFSTPPGVNIGNLEINKGPAAKATPTTNIKATDVKVLKGTLNLGGKTVEAPTTVKGGTLAGSGKTIGKVKTSGSSKLKPGNSPGSIVVFGDLEIAETDYEVELEGNDPGITYDQATATGDVILLNDVTLTILPAPIIPSFNYVIINNEGSNPVSGQFVGLPEGSTIAAGGKNFLLSYKGGDGNDVTLTFDDVSPVITCSQSRTVNNDPGTCGAIVTEKILQYNPTGPQNSPVPVPVYFAAPGVTASSLSQVGYPGWTNTNLWPVGYISSSPTVVASEYVTFNATLPNATDLANLTYHKNSYRNNGPTQASIRSSLDGFASDISTVAVNPAGDQTLKFDLSSLPVQSGNIGFRIYFYGAPAIPNDWADLVGNPNGLTGLILNRYLGATASDDLSGTTISYDVDPSQPFPVGTTVVNATATDASNNTSSCSFSVTVNDVEDPKITCPADVNHTADAGVCSYSFTPTPAGATDNCPGVTVGGVRSDGNALTDPYPVGTTTIKWTASDAHGHSVSCVQTVVVTDDENPKITCSADVNHTTDAGVCSYSFTPLATATDNCPVVTVVGVRSDALPLTDPYPVGTTTIKWTATDAHGHSASCVQTVVVTDDENPKITCPVDVNHTADASVCSYSFTPTPAGATDNCPGVTVGGVRSDGKPLGDPYPIGTTTIKWTATDAHGHGVSCVQTIKVTDDENPKITCPADVNHTADAGVCSYSFIPIPAGATDNCPGVSVGGVRSDGKPLSDPYPVGTTTIKWTASDAHGHSVSCVQTIKVTDDENPRIVCPGDVDHTADAGVCSYSFTPAPTSATDNCPGVTVGGVRSDGNALSDPYPVGTTTIKWTATDAHGHSVSCVQTIKVTDNEKPKAICKDVTVTLVNGGVSIAVGDINNNSTDNCGIQSIDVAPKTFSCSNIGANTVTLTVTDIYGNVQTCTATVTVIGEIPTCAIKSIPSNNTYTGGVPTTLYLGYGPSSTTLNPNALGGAPFTYSWTGPVGLSCTDCATPVFTATAAGTFVYTVVVTNKYGCKTTCTITITVVDARCGNKNEKVLVCQVPSGNTGNAHTVCVSPNAVATLLANGSYLGNCTNGNRTVKPELIVSVADEMNVYPNPNNGLFDVQLNNMKASKATIVVTNGNGLVIEKRSIEINGKRQTQTVSFDLSRYSSGLYYIQLITADGVKTEKVTIQR
jgi:plastocyanin